MWQFLFLPDSIIFSLTAVMFCKCDTHNVSMTSFLLYKISACRKARHANVGVLLRGNLFLWMNSFIFGGTFWSIKMLLTIYVLLSSNFQASKDQRESSQKASGTHVLAINDRISTSVGCTAYSTVLCVEGTQGVSCERFCQFTPIHPLLYVSILYCNVSFVGLRI